MSTRPFGTIRKLPSGRYQARYYHLGQQVAADTTFATKAEARAWLAAMETDLLGGRHVTPASGREEFGVFARRWVAQRDLQPRTRATYTAQLTHITAEFDRVELRNLTPGAVRAWHGRLAKSGLHPNTVAKVYRMFRTMMDTAVDDGLIRANPVHVKGAAVERAVERPALDWDDVARLANAIDPHFRALVWVGATSGLRFGELTGLQRRHVNLTDRTLRVEQAMGYVNGQGAVLGPPKSTAAHRTVSIPKRVAEILAEHLATVDTAPDSLVFASVQGGPLISGYFAPHWKRALAAAGMDSQTRFHDLRHLAGTAAATAGASLREIMARMGHASSEASLRYLQASARRDAHISDEIGRRIDQDLRGA
jgi:integrase